jgi:hypothetical protein
MPISAYYASIAIVEVHPDDSVTIESISVTEGECVLSGAWDFEITDNEKIQNVLSGKMIIPIGEKKSIEKLSLKGEIVVIDPAPFLRDAKKAAEDALVAYEAFKSEDPTKRKKLVAPDFYNWPSDVDFGLSATYLESIGKMSTPGGTPDKFKKTLAAARLVKHLIEMWQLDEQERNNRKYVEGEQAKMTILPESWLSKVI